MLVLLVLELALQEQLVLELALQVLQVLVLV
jgi:hypothetical protein